jgi:hypothetical protein
MTNIVPYFLYQKDDKNIKRYITYNATKQKFYLTTNKACAKLFKLNSTDVMKAKFEHFANLQVELRPPKVKPKRSALKGAK